MSKRLGSSCGINRSDFGGICEAGGTTLDGVDIQVLKAWMGLGFPAAATVPLPLTPGSRRYSASPPLASPGHNVIVDPVKEMALWDKWGREAWLMIVASEEDWIVDNGYTFEVSPQQFAFDLSFFAVPSSPYVNVFP